MKLKIGDKVKVAAFKMAYMPSRMMIPVGSIGIVGAVKVPCVRKTPYCKCQYFNCVDFVLNGEPVRGSYHQHELEVA